jgi:N-acetylneuraminic acid mutarotase
VNFQPLGVQRAPGMQVDYGAVYDVRRGGMSFGWSEDRQANTVDRNVTRVQRNDTFLRMNGATWEIAVPHGNYSVFIVAGDPAQTGTRVGIEVEGTLAIAAVTKPRRAYLEGCAAVHVTDGKLTIRSLAPASDLINYIGIRGTYEVDETPVVPPTQPPTQPPPVVDTQPLGTLAWSAATSLPVPRVEGMSTAIGDTLYVFGGYLDNTWAPTARVDAYNVKTNTWTRLGDMPQRISHCGTTTDGRYIYFAGGYEGLTGYKQNFASTTVRRYDPQNDTWSLLPSLPQARGGGEMFHVSGKLYYVAGSDAKRGDHSDVWMLDLSDTGAGWVTRASLPQARNHFGGAVINGKIYVTGGQTGQEDWVSFKSEAWVYDPSADQWTGIAKVPNPIRSHQTAATFAYKGWLITIGGETDGTIPGKPKALSVVNAYNPQTNTWTTLKSLPAARSTGFANVVGDRIVYSAGYNGSNFYTTTWLGTFA